MTWMSNYIRMFDVDVIIYPYTNSGVFLSWYMLVKRPQVSAIALIDYTVE